MPEHTEDENNKNLPDLSQLSGLKFETAWTPVSNSYTDSTSRAPGHKGKKTFNKDKFDKKFHDSGRAAPRGDSFGGDFKKGQRRPFPERKSDQGEFQRKQQNSKFRKFQKPFEKHQQFVPSMEVLFYPDDAPFNKLIDAMRESKRTYQLFDIAQLVLEKFDRCVILAKNLPESDGTTKPLYCAQPLNLPFDDEQDAKKAATDYYVEKLFSTESAECEPPKGNFQVVNRCTITGELLGAPNWHRYGEFLREYHARKCPKISFENFCESIESVRDPEQIEAWLSQMKTRTVYRLKEPSEGELDIFDTIEAASTYVQKKFGAELVKTYEQVRLKGANMEFLPRGRIRRNIEEEWRKQKKFPIVTANNLRGRLRRSGLTVYKRGSKGFAFVSAIKRKFLIEGDKLSELPQSIFDYILANPGVAVEKLPYVLMGIDFPEKPAAESAAEAEASAGAPAEAEGSPIDGGGEKPAVKSVDLTEEQTAKFNQILSELSWLISEGYVVEYANSSLQANPYMPKPKDKSAADAPLETPGDEPISGASAEIAEDSQEKPGVESSQDETEEEANPDTCPTTESSATLPEADKPTAELPDNAELSGGKNVSENNSTLPEEESQSQQEEGKN